MTRQRIRLALATLALGACSDGTGPEPGSSAAIRIVDSPNTMDTVTAMPIQALVVEARDDAGRLSSGTVVRFTTIAPVQTDPYPPYMELSSVSGSFFSFVAVDTTDARGRALARLRFGTRAGVAYVEISVPLTGAADTALFTVAPGNPSLVLLAPGDTAVYQGSSVQLQASVQDRFGNSRTDPVTYSLFSTPAMIGSVSSTGSVSATGVGRIGVVAGAAELAQDTAFVSVVPRATIAAIDYNTGRAITVGLDGTGYQPIGPQLSGYVEPAWSPDGTELVLTPLSGGGPDMLRVGVNGTSIPVALPTGSAYWPAYSADGQFIYYTNVNGAGIWRVRIDGSQGEAVTSGSLDYRPTMSSDGRWMAFHSFTSTVVIRVYDLQGRTYVGGDTPGMFPEWSPVSDSIAFIDVNDGRLRLMHRSGTGNRHVAGVEERLVQGQLTWSRDGRWIIARRIDGHLLLIEVATGLVLPLRLPSLAEPAWRPGS